MLSNNCRARRSPNASNTAGTRSHACLPIFTSKSAFDLRYLFLFTCIKTPELSSPIHMYTDLVTNNVLYNTQLILFNLTCQQFPSPELLEHWSCNFIMHYFIFYSVTAGHIFIVFLNNCFSLLMQHCHDCISITTLKLVCYEAFESINVKS